MMGGFTQGSCITAKYVMTYPAKYWGVFIFSGGLVSLNQEQLVGLKRYQGVDLKGTRVLVGCGDSDPFIKAKAAEWTAMAFTHVGAKVDMRIYKDLDHMVVKDELEVLKHWTGEIDRS